MQKYCQTFYILAKRKKAQKKHNHHNTNRPSVKCMISERRGISRHKKIQWWIFMQVFCTLPLGMKNPLERSNYFNIMISIKFYFPIEIFNHLISFAIYCGIFDFSDKKFFSFIFMKLEKAFVMELLKKKPRRLLLVNFFFRHSFTLFCVAIFFDHKLITVLFNEF